MPGLRSTCSLRPAMLVVLGLEECPQMFVAGLVGIGLLLRSAGRSSPFALLTPPHSLILCFVYCKKKYYSQRHVHSQRQRVVLRTRGVRFCSYVP
jgi:hypothetical protein